MLTNEIKFAKLHNDVIIPSKREEDAGFDIYPYFDEEFMCFAPHETRMVPTGLVSNFSPDYVVVLKERGSTGTKGIGQRCGVIDSGFRGEWMVPITNHNSQPMIITKTMDAAEIEMLQDIYVVYPYTKAICQALMLLVPKMTVVEATVEDVMGVGSERGKGKLGSSGK